MMEGTRTNMNTTRTTGSSSRSPSTSSPAPSAPVVGMTHSPVACVRARMETVVGVWSAAVVRTRLATRRQRRETCPRNARDRAPCGRECCKCWWRRWSEAGSEMEGKEERGRSSGRREGAGGERRRTRRWRRREEEREGNDWLRFGRVGGKLD